ncbi:wax synthase family protein [Abortiporus biennis]
MTSDGALQCQSLLTANQISARPLFDLRYLRVDCSDSHDVLALQSLIDSTRGPNALEEAHIGLFRASFVHGFIHNPLSFKTCTALKNFHLTIWLHRSFSSSQPVDIIYGINLIATLPPGLQHITIWMRKHRNFSLELHRIESESINWERLDDVLSSFPNLRRQFDPVDLRPRTTYSPNRGVLRLRSAPPHTFNYLCVSIYVMYEALRDLLSHVVPSRIDQVPISAENLSMATLHFLPHTVMLYLSRKRGTDILRKLLCPLAVMITLRSTFKYTTSEMEHPALGYIRGIVGLAIVVASIDLAFVPKRNLKSDETSIPDTEDFLAELKKSWDASFTVRGIGWKFGEGVHLSTEGTNLKRSEFLFMKFLATLKHLVILEICHAIFMHVPGATSRAGGSIFFQHLPTVQKYTLSTILCFIFSVYLVSFLTMVFDILAIFGVGILGQSPAVWPPLMDNPWSSTSLHEFWGKRWHHMARRTLIVAGGMPGRFVAGHVGEVVGVFVASGLLHELSLYVFDRQLDYQNLLFFTMQAVGMICEEIYRYVTGRRLGGMLGRVWTVFFIAVLGQLAVDAWLSRGMLAGSGAFLPGIQPFVIALIGKGVSLSGADLLILDNTSFNTTPIQ